MQVGEVSCNNFTEENSHRSSMLLLLWTASEIHVQFAAGDKVD